ncbi:MFS transporter [Ilyomonas limi]|uniref:MFS transporter n=1 Tax=Ilyomonas limi TaxID=2575867 RepID=A0A4V5UUJ2_9BACT|nr:MFS transporter [Ilyomonas limi]TKK69243.1 MFS transporter [Ilyomonas limi]
MINQTKQYNILSFPVLVAALGYFVDIYDLLLFSIIRVPSLKNIGLTDVQITTAGEHIISVQMVGLLLGGIFWGILGDKKGRLSVLFGSILLYSLANIANGFVHTADQYAWTRFIAGIGLAGELGAGITLVSELIPKEKRGIATSVVAGAGLLGAIVAFFTKEYFVQPDGTGWRTCYFIGGGLGFALLLLRISVFESGMYQQIKQTAVQRGNFFMLFSSGERFKRYLLSIAIGLPTWYVIGVLVTFSKEFGAHMHIAGPIDAGKAVMYAYIGIAIGDILIGFISQKLKSRKKALYLFYAMAILFTILFFTIQYNGTANMMYLLCGALGFSMGFWAIFVTIGAEQFGTNLRATATTTIPNFVRGILPLIIILFEQLRTFLFNRSHNADSSYITGAWITGAIVIFLGLIAVINIRETFGKDLNFLEH